MREAALALRLEIFKASRQRLTWAVLGLILLVVLLNTAISYQAYRDVRRYAADAVRHAPPQQRQQVALRQELVATVLRDSLVLPGAYGGITRAVYFPGLVFVSVAAGSMVGSEFAWGTVHRLLARGQRRWVFVVAKLGLVGMLAAASVVVGLVGGSGGGLWTTHVLQAWNPGAFTGAVWVELAIVSVRLWAVLFTYGAAAAAAGFLFRSTGLGVAAALIYHFIDVFASTLIVQGRGWLAAIRPYLLSSVTRALMVEHNPFLAGIVSQWGDSDPARVLSPQAAWLTLGLWAAAFVVLSFACFLRRDLTV